MNNFFIYFFFRVIKPLLNHNSHAGGWSLWNFDVELPGKTSLPSLMLNFRKFLFNFWFFRIIFCRVKKS